MIKAHRHAPVMRRSARVYLNDLNTGKVETLTGFLHQCHDITQYFVDLFWQRQDFSSTLSDLETVHKGRDKFNITTRLAQAMAKQAKETVKSAHERVGHKPQLHNHTTTLYSHFVKVETFTGSFDFAVTLTGSGAPRMVIPVHSTKVINNRLADGWQIGKTIRLGLRRGRIFIDFILEKPRPAKRESGVIVGMDSNYKNGLVFSDGQSTGNEVYQRIQAFSKRQKHTHVEVKSLIRHSLKGIDFSNIRMLCIESLKSVKSGTRGKFPRKFNRRLSHWLYASTVDWIKQKCEETGTRLVEKNPAHTSQFCSICGKWDKRNRVGDRFKCVHCGFSNHADLNAAQNLALLGEAGVYGLRSLPNLNLCS
ncbi:MAG: zinc ribbon domain-containing protein [Dehalococcoidia bacterium]